MIEHKLCLKCKEYDEETGCQTISNTMNEIWFPWTLENWLKELIEKCKLVRKLVIEKVLE